MHNKWVYGLKEEHDVTKRYKVRMIVKEFQQQECTDFTKIFSSIMKLTTIRSILSIMAAEDLHLEHLDVKTVFLYSDLEDDTYMMQPQGYIMPRNEQWVCKLKKSLDSLK